MKAVMMNAPGEPEVLQPAQADTPAISRPSEMLVRLKAAGINPIDTKLRGRGTYYPDRLPAILGCDGAGVVEAVGEGVSRFQPGDAVYFCHGGIGGHPGTYAEYAVVDQEFAAPKPASLDFTEAAAVPLVLITAWEALHDRAHVEAGHTVLVHAGAGGVGHVAIQLARLAGARVCTTVGSAQKADFVTELGAELTIDYHAQDFAQVARAWTDGEGVDIAFDTVGGATFEQSFSAVRLYGDLVTLLQPGADVDWKEARLRNLRVALELMLSPMYLGQHAAQAHQAGILAEGAQLIDAGKLGVHVAQVFPLSEAAAAHRQLEQGGFVGKLVLDIDG
ncbi:MAG TPA: zinc-dependent alcohol dehydrogenase family protein [Gammaproteobacteria bacterium]|nr:zinc-dependent alcohol dehydrogenase family protein [Gammaproteobacteria bacterium]